MARNSKQVAHATVRTAHGAVPVRFIRNGKMVRVSSRGLPKLRMFEDKEHGQVVVRSTAEGAQTTLRVDGQDMRKAFSAAVTQFWS